MSSLRTTIARPRTSSGTPSVTDSMWFGTSSSVSSNQNVESPVSTAPLSGIGVGWTTSYVEIRSEATIRIRSRRSYISRTFPAARSGRSATVVTGGMLAARITASGDAELGRDLVHAGAQSGELGAQRIERGGCGVQACESGVGARRRQLERGQDVGRLGLQRLEPSCGARETLNDGIGIADGSLHGGSVGRAPDAFRRCRT